MTVDHQTAGDPGAPETSVGSAVLLLYRHVSPRLRRQFWWIMLLMIGGAIAELATISSIVPFLALISAPARVSEYPWVVDFASISGFDGSADIVMIATFAFMTLVIISAVVRLLLAWANRRFAFAVGRDLGVNVYKRILHQPFRYHASSNSSAVLAAINKAQAVAAGVFMPIMQGLSACLIVIGILAALLFVNAGIALSVGAVLASVYFLTNRIVHAQISRNGAIVASAHTQRVKTVQEGIGGIRDIILEGAQAAFLQQFSIVESRFRDAQARNDFMRQSPRFVIEAFGILVIASLAYMMSRAEGGVVDAIPLLGGLALGAQRLLPQAQQIYGSFSSVTASRSMLSDLIDFLQLPEPPVCARDSRPMRFDHAISLDGVCFRHGANGPWTLAEVSLSVKKGDKVAIFGETGAGKSTLADLLMGLVEPDQGDISIDGVALKNEKIRAWQKNIAHVPQHVFLLDASITLNIVFSTGTVDMERVRRAARQAELFETIERMPEGFDTRVGERGAMLSGGERQRLGIARALYKESQVLILDEPTSAIDNETAQYILSNIEQEGRDLTIIMITHNPEVAGSFSRRLEVRDGGVFELA